MRNRNKKLKANNILIKYNAKQINETEVILYVLSVCVNVTVKGINILCVCVCFHSVCHITIN